MRLRFRLKTFLIVVSLAGIVCAWIGVNAAEHRREQEALAQINAVENIELLVTNLRADWQSERQYIWG